MRSLSLESMVGYLAGREGEPSSAIRAELADPSSEASRFLEATRRRSRALLEDRPARFALVGKPAQPRLKLRLGRAATAALVAASVLISAGGALWLAESRLNRFEATLANREAESRLRAHQLELALARVVEPSSKPVAPPSAAPSPRPQPFEQALARVEVGLGRLDRRIESLDRPNAGPAPAPAADSSTVGLDPTISEIRREVAALRRELVSSDQAGARQVMEIRLALQDVGNLLRMALSRPTVALPMTIPSNTPNFANGQPTQIFSLMGNLGHAHPQTRLESVEQLGRMGQDAQMAIPSLEQVHRHDADPQVRAAAKAALGAIHPR